MADVTPNMGLVLPNEDEYYDIEIFNENFRKIDAAKPRVPLSFVSADEPPDWSADDWTDADVWYQILAIREKPEFAAILETAPHDPASPYLTEIGGTLYSVTNAAESEITAQEGDIIIKI